MPRGDGGEMRRFIAAPALLCLLPLLTAALTGCGHTLAPGAENVVITRKDSDVNGCRVVGPVSFSRTQKNEALKNYVLGMGADTLFLTRHDTFAGTGSNGIAYLCRGFDPRAPVPVAVPKS